MKTNRELTDLKNIGSKITSRLNEVGVFSENDLRGMGAAEAHKLIKQIDPNETLSVCYYLYSFEGALSDTHWNDIGEQRKKELQNQIR